VLFSLNVSTVIFSLMVRFYDFTLLFPSLDLNQAGLFLSFYVNSRICYACLFFRDKSGRIIFVFQLYSVFCLMVWFYDFTLILSSLDLNRAGLFMSF
jgi:hypothetical protein